jgi:AcrR family transcriptional regulator
VGSRSRRVVVAKAQPRERLLDAMIQAAARYGYREASVARVVEQAGVSRATFYELFADKQACFLAAFGRAAQPVEVAVADIDLDLPPGARAARLLDELLGYVVRDPAAARTVLIEALGGAASARRAHDRLMLNAEAALERCLSTHDQDQPLLTISGRAVMEGTAGILGMRAFRGETARLADLRGDLLTWIESYRAPAGHPHLDSAAWSRLGAGLVAPSAPAGELPAAKLPRGKSAVAPEVVAGEHRERILAAVATLAREQGYAAMTVAGIVKEGAVTREAFYELFRSKEDAFLAAQSAGLEASVASSAAKFFSADSWPDRVWNGLEALLTYVSTQPDLIYVELIESYAAGAPAIRRSFDSRMAYTLFLEDGYRQSAAAESLPRLCSEAIAGAILGLMRWQVSAGRGEKTLELLPQAVYVALAPFIGPTAAIELVETKVAGAADAPTA